MKTFILFGVGVLAGTLFLPAQVLASPGGFTGRLTAYQTYAADGVSELHLDPVLHGGPKKWSFGAYAEFQRRRVELDNLGSRSADWDAETMMMFIGYDVLPQITLLAGVGSSDLDIGSVNYGSDASGLLAARMRLLDYLVFDPLQRANLYYCRIDTVIHYQASNADRGLRELSWSEVRGALTASFVTRPHRLGYFDSAGIYFGPAFSRLRGSDTNPRERWEGKDDFGIVAGAFMNPGRHTMLKMELARFERNSFNFAAGFHF